jgi:hypothetical protein
MSESPNLIKVGVIGSRGKFWDEMNAESIARSYINRYLWARRHYCQFVSGGSPGGGTDIFVRDFCKTSGLTYKEFTPKRNTREEYFARNTDIANYCDVIVAFCAGKVTPGTWDTIKKARALNKKIYIYTYNGIDWQRTTYND